MKFSKTSLVIICMFLIMFSLGIKRDKSENKLSANEKSTNEKSIKEKSNKSKSRKEKTNVQEKANSEASVQNQANTEASVQNQANTEASVQNQANTEASVQNKANTEASVQNQANTEASVQNQANTEASVQNKANTEASVQNQANTETSVESKVQAQGKLMKSQAEYILNSSNNSGPDSKIVLTQKSWTGWITENNNLYSDFELDVSDIINPQTQISKKGLVLKLVSGNILKGKMSKFLEKVDSADNHLYIIPYRTCGPIEAYNPFVARKYYFMTCNNIYIKFTFAYLDIDNKEWIYIKELLEKNRTNRINWINETVKETLKQAEIYKDSKKIYSSSITDNMTFQSLIESFKKEANDLKQKKITEGASYTNVESQLNVAQREHAINLQSRNTLTTKSVEITGLINELKTSIESLKIAKTSGQNMSSEYRSKAEIAKTELMKILKSLEIEAPSAKTKIQSIIVTDNESTIRTISSILP